MIINLLSILAGFVVLVWSADRFVYGAAGIAQKLGMSTLMIGLTIVALGTSAPEIMVSSLAAFEGSPGLAIGNAVGSNIANIGLVLGVAVLISPIYVPEGVRRRELPALFLITAVVGVLFFDEYLQFFDGLVLIAMLIAWMGLLIYISKQKPDQLELEEDIPDTTDSGLVVLLGWFLLSLLLLLGSSRLLVWAATNIASDLGVSDVIIGLTIVAIGTSLPELAAAVASALKKHHDLVIGNVVGSNILNLLTVLPLPALIHPTELSAEVFERDYATMLATTVALMVFVYLIGRRGDMPRWHGSILLGTYIGYMIWLYLQATSL